MLTTRHSVPRYVLSGASAIVLSYAIWQSGARLYAERLISEGTLPAVEHALRVEPRNAQFWLWYADALEQAALPAESALLRAAALNPRDASTLIRIGLNAEGRSDYPAAERYLLDAAKASRLYQPRWTLANYYLRRDAEAAFWTWARRAMELAPREPDALFRLCWRVTEDPAEIMEKALPESPAMWRAYLHFLLATKRYSAAAIAIGRLKDAGPEATGVLLDACDRFLENRMAQPAVAAWNLSCRRAAVPCQEMNPASTPPLTNGGFQLPGFGQGFNWRFDRPPGITARMGGGKAAVYFSGKQAEQALTIWQWVPVLPSKPYDLRFEYQTEGVEDRSGLRWQVAGTGAGTGLDPLAVSDELSASVWKEVTLHFTAPAGVPLVRMALICARTPGSVRTDGAIVIRNMSLTSPS